jgi:hypothetical protein
MKQPYWFCFAQLFISLLNIVQSAMLTTVVLLVVLPFPFLDLELAVVAKT